MMMITRTTVIRMVVILMMMITRTTVIRMVMTDDDDN